VKAGVKAFVIGARTPLAMETLPAISELTVVQKTIEVVLPKPVEETSKSGLLLRARPMEIHLDVMG
jgi:hypothetical protein